MQAAGRYSAALATIAPGMPATVKPISGAMFSSGPGASVASATKRENCAESIQCSLFDDVGVHLGDDGAAAAEADDRQQREDGREPNVD